MNIFFKIFKIARACFLVLYAFLLILHFIVKDRVNDLIYLFYGTPKPILLLINIILIGLFFKSKKTRNLLIGSFSILFFIWFINDTRIFGKSPDNESDFSVLYWNTAHGEENSIQLISDKIEQLSPDIIGLVEAGNMNEKSFNKYQNQLYNYQFKKIGSDILVGIKGEIINSINYDSNHFYKYGKIDIQISSKAYTLFIVDIFANQPYFRKRILDEFYNSIHPEKNNIVLGDFNTPYESIHLKPFKENFWNAERKSGSGFIASWPDKLHLLQIDHIWSSKKITPVFSYNESTDLSDHSIIYTKFKNSEIRLNNN